MSINYDKTWHTHCAVEGLEQGTYAIILHVGTRVWIAGSHADLSRETNDVAVIVYDRFSNGYDEDGNCIISVPAERCHFYTEEEAAGIEACIEADHAMLRNAR